MNRSRQRWLVGGMTALAMVAFSCGGGAAAPTATRPAPTATVAAPAPSPTALAPAATRPPATAAAPAPQPTATPTRVAARTGPKGKLVIGQSGEDPSIDPHRMRSGGGFRTAFYLFEGLLQRDYKGDLIPGMATSWKLSSDATYSEFTLRKDIKFHNGDPMTARDVKFSYDRSVDPALRYVFGGDLRGRTKSVEVLDDYTVRFQHVGKDPAYPTLMFVYFFVAPQDHIGKVGSDEFAKRPVGTGPFKFVNWRVLQDVTIEAFEGHYDRVPLVRTVTIKNVPEITTLVAMLRAGEADVVAGVPPFMASELNAVPGLKVISQPVTTVSSYTFDTLSGPFTNKLLRQAVAYAIDKDAMIKDLRMGFGTRVTAAIGPGNIGSEWLKDYPDQYPYDPKKAKQLVIEAGYPSGLEFPIYTTSGWGWKNEAEMAAGYLAQIGMKGKVQFMESGTMFTLLPEKKLTAGMIYWGNASSTFDSLPGLVRNIRTNGFYSYVSDSELDKLIDQTSEFTDPVARAKHLAEIYKKVQDRAYWVATYGVLNLYGVSDRVQNFRLVDGFNYISKVEYMGVKD